MTNAQRAIAATLSGLIALSLIALSANSFAQAQTVPVTKRIFVDPLFGGSDTGPVITADWPAKRLTLAYANALRDAVKQRGATVFLSRSADVEVSEVDRWTARGRNKANWHIAFSASRGTKNCVRLNIPTEEQAWKQKENTGSSSPESNELGNKLFYSANRHISIRSNVVATRVQEALVKRGECATVEKRHLPTLDLARVATIVIELENATPIDQGRHFFGDTFQKELAQVVAGVLVEISETDFPPNARLPR